MPVHVPVEAVIIGYQLVQSLHVQTAIDQQVEIVRQPGSPIGHRQWTQLEESAVLIVVQSSLHLRMHIVHIGIDAGGAEETLQLKPLDQTTRYVHEGKVKCLEAYSEIEWSLHLGGGGGVDTTASSITDDTLEF